MHWITLALCLGFISIACITGKNRLKSHTECRFRTALAWFIIVFQSFAMLWWLWPANFRLDQSLPLHICDLSVWLCVFAILTKRRWALTMVFFWGIGLSSQGFFTPILQQGPAHAEFWLFWVGHLQIVGTAIYAMVVLDYRPDAQDLCFAILTSLAYGLVIGTFDAIFKLNYGYIGPAKPDQTTLIDILGPWPQRLIPLTAIVLSLFTILWALARHLPCPKPEPDEIP